MSDVFHVGDLPYIFFYVIFNFLKELLFVCSVSFHVLENKIIES